MTKEQQESAAARIREKVGALTADEEVTYRLLTMRPENYIPPDPVSGDRVCGICGEVFENSMQSPALEKMAEHITIHNPTGSQWSEAHRRIQKGNDSAKSREKDEPR
jgi:hypothetical protein